MMKTFPDFIDQFPPVTLPAKGVELRVVKGESGQVAFFQMATGSGVPPHNHDDSWATLVEGKMSVTVGDETFVAQKGDSWFVPKGVTHGGEALEECLMIEVFKEQRFEL